MRSCVRRLKSSENRLPQPSNLHCGGEGAHSDEHTHTHTHTHRQTDLERLFAGVHELVALELGAVNEALKAGERGILRQYMRHTS
jgi:hypothetical protein